MSRQSLESASHNPLQQCPCCDYFTLHERGRYEICAVCYWEDEPLLDEFEPSVANHGLSLANARINFLSIGACYSAVKKHVLPENRRAIFEHHQRPVTVPKSHLSS